jgi:hypothetical protein
MVAVMMVKGVLSIHDTIDRNTCPVSLSREEIVRNEEKSYYSFR